MGSADTSTEDPDIGISKSKTSDPYCQDIRIVRISVLSGYSHYPNPNFSTNPIKSSRSPWLVIMIVYINRNVTVFEIERNIPVIVFDGASFFGFFFIAFF